LKQLCPGAAAVSFFCRRLIAKPFRGSGLEDVDGTFRFTIATIVAA